MSYYSSPWRRTDVRPFSLRSDFLCPGRKNSFCFLVYVFSQGLRYCFRASPVCAALFLCQPYRVRCRQRLPRPLSFAGSSPHAHLCHVLSSHFAFSRSLWFEEPLRSNGTKFHPAPALFACSGEEVRLTSPSSRINPSCHRRRR